jgi:hypothetical protein
MDPVESYLAELRDIRASGAAVPETSGCGALANLLSEVGGEARHGTVSAVAGLHD